MTIVYKPVRAILTLAILFCLALGGTQLHAVERTGWTVYSKSMAMAYAEPVSAYRYANDFDGTFEGGGDAFAFAWTELGVRQGSFSVAAVKELLIMSEPSDDTARLFYIAKNKLPLNPGEQFALSLDAYHVRLDGLKFTWQQSFANRLGVTVGVKYLTANDFLDGSFRGNATAVAQNEYEFDTTFDYAYSEDPLFDRPFDGADGKGWAVDIDLVWRFNADLMTFLNVRNLWGEIAWDDAGITTGDGSSSTQSFGPDGFVEFRPVLQGLERTGSFTQKLPHSAIAGMRYFFADTASVDLTVYHNPVVSHAALAIANRWGGFWAQGVWLPELDALGVKTRWRGLELSLVSDNWTLRDAHFLQATLGISVPISIP